MKLADSDVAIVGMGCRMPGASNPSELWELLKSSRDVQRKMPENRYNVDGYYDPNGKHKGTTNAPYGYFLDQDISLFDPGFFNMSGLEAESMDPQQRLLLEVTYEALENAGITLREISGTNTAVFSGFFTRDYFDATNKDFAAYPLHTAIGTGAAIVANRISYCFNLQGASVSIDTACSSSLVALHLGVQAIKNGESDVAIITGSALHFGPDFFITLTDLGMLSADGRCRSFDAKGSGYVRGDGICTVVLKRASLAQKDGNQIRALVRGSLTSHNGDGITKQGITLPSSEAQEELIRRTYANANIRFEDTQYYEAHGTGTPAGDHREAGAIGRVFASGRDEPMIVGSIKSNVGHLEGASGLASVIKSVLALEHGQIPANMHFEDPSPKIDFVNWKIKVPTKLEDWPETHGAPRRVSINSTGYGGANAHIVLEYPRLSRRDTPSEARERPFLLPITSHTSSAGKLQAARLAEYLEKNPAASLQDVATTLSTRRTMHRFRNYVAAQTNEEAILALRALSTSSDWTAAGASKSKVGFVFTGQGAQWWAMGRNLIRDSLHFQNCLARCDDVLQSLPDGPSWSVKDELLQPKEKSRVMQTAFSQPLCTAVQLGVVSILREWGISPSAVVGHSSGEVAAAYAAGILSFEDAITVAYYRGLYMSSVPSGSKKGSMMAVGIGERDALEVLGDYRGRANIAAVNSPESVTLAGDDGAIEEIKAIFTSRKLFVRKLQVAQAFHSHHMLPLAPGYLAALEAHRIAPREPTCLMWSSVTARPAEYSRMGSEYWVQNMVSPVRFSDALQGILLDENDEPNVDLLVEIGPHAALKGPAQQILTSLELDIPYFASLLRGSPDYHALLNTAGRLFANGYERLEMELLNAKEMQGGSAKVSLVHGKRLLELPPYSWDHRSYWADTRVSRNMRFRKHRHELLGARISEGLDAHPAWRNFLRQSEIPWLKDHKVQGAVIFPGAGYVALAVEAISQLYPSSKSVHIKDAQFKVALAIPDGSEGVEIIVSLHPVTKEHQRDSKWYHYSIHSFRDGGFSTEHSCGLVGAQAIETQGDIAVLAPTTSVEGVHHGSTHRISSAAKYKALKGVGLDYGDAFQGLQGDIEAGPGVSAAPIHLSETALPSGTWDKYALHPGILDSAIQLAFPALESLVGHRLTQPWVPAYIEHMTLSGRLFSREVPVSEFLGNCKIDSTSSRTTSTDISLFSKDKENQDCLVSLSGLRLASLPASGVDTQNTTLFYRVRWLPDITDFVGVKRFLTDQNVSSVSDTLAHLVDLFLHKYRNSAALVVSPPRSAKSFTATVLRSANSDMRGQRIANINVVSNDFDTVESVAEFVDFSNGLVTSTTPQSQSNLVILDKFREDGDGYLQYLQPGGFVFAVDSNSIQGLKWVGELAGVEVYKNEMAPDPPAQSEPPEELAIITLVKDSSKLITNVIDSIKALSGPRRVTTVSLDDVLESSLPRDLIVLASLEKSLLFDDAKNLEALVQLVTRTNSNVIFCTQGALFDCSQPENSSIVGLIRSARAEAPAGTKIGVYDLDPSAPQDPNGIAKSLCEALVVPDGDEEVVQRGSVRYIPRLQPDTSLNSKLPTSNAASKASTFSEFKNLGLCAVEPGNIESLAFRETEHFVEESLKEDEVLVEVRASGVSEADLFANGISGHECSGVIVKVGSSVPADKFRIGQPVLCWLPNGGAHSKLVRVSWTLAVQCEGLSFPEAASLPVILTTAYIALHHIGRVRINDVILIGSAASPLGQMLLQLSMTLGSRPIAVVTTREEKAFLQKTYGLHPSQVSLNRKESITASVDFITGRKGVDLAVGLEGELTTDFSHALASLGSFIHIVNDSAEAVSKQSHEFERISHSYVNIRDLYLQNPALASDLYSAAFELVRSGRLRSVVPIEAYSYSNAFKAFTRLRYGQSPGKLVFVAGPFESVRVPVLSPSYDGQRLFHADKFYLLVGGFGGLGRAMAEWFYSRGARKLAFLSRSGSRSDKAQALVSWLLERNVDTRVHEGDITIQGDVQKCVSTYGKDLGGIVQAAMCIDSNPLQKMTQEQWMNALLPKTKGTLNLHHASHDLPLDFFICVSSITALNGELGLANYVAGNLFQDALMRKRREAGLVGVTVNLGQLEDIGFAAENEAARASLNQSNVGSINQEEVFYILEEGVRASRVISCRSADGVDRHQILGGVNTSRQDLHWANRSIFQNLYQKFDSDEGKNVTTSLRSILRSTADKAAAAQILMEAFVGKVARILALEPKDIEPSGTLNSYGLDSLVAFQIRSWFVNEAGIELSTFEVMSGQTLKALIDTAVSLVTVEESDAKAEEAVDAKEQTKVSVEKPAARNGIASDSSLKFWEESLKGIQVGANRFPFAKGLASDATQRYALTGELLRLGPMKKLRGFCKRSSVPEHVVLLAAFRLFHYRYTRADDFIIWVRSSHENDGPGEQYLPVRISIQPEDTFFSVLQRCEQAVVECEKRADASLDVIRKALPESALSASELALSYRRKELQPQEGSLDTRGAESYELTLEAFETASDTLAATVKFASGLYDREDINRTLENFGAFLHSAICDPKQPVDSICMCGPTDLTLQKLRANNYRAQVPESRYSSFVERFFQAAEEHADRTAITAPDGITLSYSELLKKVSAVAGAVRSRGIKQAQCIGVYGPGCPDTVVGILGTVLAGCCYVPMDSDFAPHRLRFMADDSQAPLILVGQGQLYAQAQDIFGSAKYKPVVLAVDSIVAEQVSENGDAVDYPNPEDPLYLLYTSGSTGEPKGVQISHRSLQSFVETWTNLYNVTHEDAFLLSSSISFDMSVTQIFTCFTNGGKLCIPAAHDGKDPLAIAELGKREGITFTVLTPTLLSLLLTHAENAFRGWHRYRVTIIGGERPVFSDVQKLYSLGTPVVAFNGWGLTETTCCNTSFEIPRTSSYTDACSTVGLANPNSHIVVLDGARNPVPPGVVGEICVGGPVLPIDGYFRRPDLTARAFFRGPFGDALLFGTGDLGLLRADGQVELRGRIAEETTVKLRGYRIVLREIEHHIRAQAALLPEQEREGSGINNVSVLIRRLREGDADEALVGYIVPKARTDRQKHQQFISALHDALKQNLNHYMLPNCYQLLTELPLTVSGKVDKTRLASWPLEEESLFTAQGAAQQGEGDAQESGDDVVSELVRLFKLVLKQDSEDSFVSPEASFFALGGHSMAFMRLQGEVRRSFGTSPSLGIMFQNPTPKGIAEQLRRVLETRPVAKK